MLQGQSQGNNDISLNINCIRSHQVYRRGWASWSYYFGDRFRSWLEWTGRHGLLYQYKQTRRSNRNKLCPSSQTGLSEGFLQKISEKSRSTHFSGNQNDFVNTESYKLPQYSQSNRYMIIQISGTDWSPLTLILSSPLVLVWVAILWTLQILVNIDPYPREKPRWRSQLGAEQTAVKR